MKKTLLVFVCLFIALSSFAQDAVSISHNLPSNINPGQTVDVDFTINKGSVGGFAKFQMDLPFGFTATAVDPKGGNFTYENQRVKIVWVSVPGDAAFTFKFKITVPANAVNSCSVSSKFFYLENNVKKEVEMAAYFIKIGNNNDLSSTPTATVASTPTPTVAATPTVASTPTETVTPTEVVTSDPTTTYTTEPVATPTVATTPTVDSTPKEVVTSTPTNTVTSTPVTSTAKTTSTATAGTTYKIQLGAFSSAPAKSKFPGISISVVEEGGFYKALSGNFSSIEQAQKHKADLAAKGYQGFVVVYQNGQRVGIQK